MLIQNIHHELFNNNFKKNRNIKEDELLLYLFNSNLINWIMIAELPQNSTRMKSNRLNMSQSGTISSFQKFMVRRFNLYARSRKYLLFGSIACDDIKLHLSEKKNLTVFNARKDLGSIPLLVERG